MKLLLQVCAFVGCLLAGLAVAQPIEGIVARDVKAEFESICAPELSAMLASRNSLGQNGPWVEQYYLTVSRLDAEGVQALIRQYRGQTPGLLPRRSDTPQYRATNIWENCLLNVRLA